MSGARAKRFSDVEPLPASVSVVLKHRDIIEDRIDSGVQKIHYFVGLKRAVATLFSLRP